MFRKRNHDDDTPESHVAYLTTIDGAFAQDQQDEGIVDKSVDNPSQNERYANARPHGEHDAAGKAGGPKGSVRFGEGSPAQPRYFSMDPKSGEHMGGPARAPEPPTYVPVDMVDDIERAIADAAGSRGSGPDHDERAIRARGSLIAASIISVLLVIMLAVFVVLALSEVAAAETQQTQTGGKPAVSATFMDPLDQPQEEVTRQITLVPGLTTLIGATKEQALDKLGHGAEVSKSASIHNQENGAVKRLTVPLTAEQSSGSTGTPTVWLDLNAEGAVVAAGYRTELSNLGYGSISFKQAIGKERVIQKALKDAGLTLADESKLKLPKSARAYSKYKSDGKTVIQHKKTFSGAGKAAGMTYRWSGTVYFDYRKANSDSDLAYTRRWVQVGISV